MVQKYEKRATKQTTTRTLVYSVRAESTSAGSMHVGRLNYSAVLPVHMSVSDLRGATSIHCEVANTFQWVGTVTNTKSVKKREPFLLLIYSFFTVFLLHLISEGRALSVPASTVLPPVLNRIGLDLRHGWASNEPTTYLWNFRFAKCINSHYCVCYH